MDRGSAVHGLRVWARRSLGIDLRGKIAVFVNTPALALMHPGESLMETIRLLSPSA